MFYSKFTQPFEKKCALYRKCTKLKVYYIKKLVTKKVCTKLKECTKSKCTKSREDCTSTFFTFVPCFTHGMNNFHTTYFAGFMYKLANYPLRGA